MSEGLDTTMPTSAEELLQRLADAWSSGYEGGLHEPNGPYLTQNPYRDALQAMKSQEREVESLRRFLRRQRALAREEPS